MTWRFVVAVGFLKNCENLQNGDAQVSYRLSELARGVSISELEIFVLWDGRAALSLWFWGFTFVSPGPRCFRSIYLRTRCFCT